MDWGKWEEETEGQTDGHWGGGHHLGSLRGPGPGGDTGGLSVREHPGSPPSPQVWGHFVQNGVFSAQTEARKKGCCPHLPLSIEGFPNVFVGDLGC